MIINPKARFLAKETQAQQWGSIASSDLFAEAAQTAMLNIAMGLPDALNANDAAANEYRRQGARLFLVQLATLTDPVPQKTAPATPHNLDHKV